jgi:hypothetical protein
MTEMNGHNFSLPRLQSMFDAISDDATVPEYFDELAGALARRILAKQEQESGRLF